jgi:nucleoside-diphosphate-sugar epimerase
LKKILIIGGSGYIGQVLSHYFLKKKYKVEVIDNLIYDQNNIALNLHNNINFSYQFLDMKNIFKSKSSNLYDSIIILAGLVGDPITKKYPQQSKIINEKYIQSIIKKIIKYEISNKTIFVSTCSNYGLNENKILDEESELKPLSLYAKSKVKIEKFIINNFGEKNFSPTILRFATAFGVSPRMRFDLTLNEFTKELYFGNKLSVYDPETWRPYCHVLDFAQAIDLVINSKKNITTNQIYNVGSDKNNHTKKDIIDTISKYIPNPKVRYVNKSIDKRNYRVNFAKIKKELHFNSKYSIDYGIREIIESLEKNYFKFDISNQYGNYQIKAFEKKNL